MGVLRIVALGVACAAVACAGPRQRAEDAGGPGIREAPAPGQLVVIGPAGTEAWVAAPDAPSPHPVSLPCPALTGAAGTWRVRAVRPGGRDYRAAVRVTAGGTSRLEIPAPAGSEPFIVVRSEVLPLSSAVRVVSHLDPDGLDFSRLAPTAFSRRTGGAVRQIVLHADLTGSARETFDVLARKGLSSHFAIDWDGTIHQLLDPRWRAYHAGAANDASVGIDLNNWMRNLVREPGAPPWPPGHPAWEQSSEPGVARPLSPERRINGLRTRSWGYTEPQYRALAELARVLAAALPEIDLSVPVGPLGEVPATVQPRGERLGGIVAHWHLSASRWDPGPGFEWTRLLEGLAGRQAPPRPPQEDALAGAADGGALARRWDDAADTPCWHTPGCPLEGLCSESETASCIAATDDDCRRSDLCAQHGQCRAREGRCVATTDGDCQGSGACQSWGFCRLAAGVCRPDGAPACRRWPGCSARGECSLAAGAERGPAGASCVVATNADCALSQACRSGHRCRALEGRCVAADAMACRRSPGCAARGDCALGPAGVCGPGSTLDCAESAACAERGLCRLVEGRCAPGSDVDCESSARCARVGECTRIDSAAGPICGLARDGDCAAMGACATFGRCTAVDGRCRAPSDAACLDSEACATRGWCRMLAGYCVALDDAHCAASARCHDAGYCRREAALCVR